MNLEIHERLADVGREEWDRLVGDGSPFLEWEFLTALEETRCVSARAGWLPQHLVLRDGGHLIGACPLYVKSHSMGEFVFDHGWAEGAERAGIRYYPKLLVAVPFTPVAGARFLVESGANATEVRRALGTALREICDEQGMSSVHVNFCRAEEAEDLSSVGFDQRLGYQFHWRNHGWQSFDDYLAALRSKRRYQIRRERRAMEEQRVRLECRTGDEIPDDMIPLLYRLYRSTVDKFFWGRPYLNRKLFDRLGERWRHRLQVVLAHREDGDVIAGAINVRKGRALYGRYWGAFEEVPFLHFNVCYYEGIDYCLREGLGRFEPGAGGEFKRLRGFDAVATTSMHYIADPRLAGAVADFLARERHAVDRAVDVLGDHSAFRKR